MNDLRRIIMYTKQEISRQKQAFWTAFGQYMKPVLSADGEKISWLNYKTGNRYIHFKMDADSRQARIAVLIQQPGGDRVYFERFLQMKAIFEETLAEQDWVWERDHTDEQGRAVSLVHKTLTGVNLFKRDDWPAIISFLKPRIIALDGLWSMVRYQFSSL
jgi:Domain of unknown function (DUF4268)